MFTTYEDVIIKDTHRGLLYEDGKLTRVLEAGLFRIARPRFTLSRRAQVEVVLVDVREREFTIKGQEILTGDKVAIRASIVVQFRVVDPRAAVHEVTNYEERLYTDVQLAARRSLASMSLEEILTNRNRLSGDILEEVKGIAAAYGVSIQRADVKDLVFPGNLQEIMNRVLAAERNAEATLVDVRTKAEAARIEASARAERERLEAETAAHAVKVRTQADVDALKEREQAANAYAQHPALLRLRELETLREMAQVSTARIYIGFDKHMDE